MRSHNIRINIVLDETLVKACQKATGIKTRRELLDYALHELLVIKNNLNCFLLREKFIGKDKALEVIKKFSPLKRLY